MSERPAVPRRVEALPLGLRIGRRRAAFAVAAVAFACASAPPRRPDDLCAIFRERYGWYRAARASAERWGLPEPVQLAIVAQESSFRARARPPRRRWLWIFPGPRPSSAYGYGQVKDDTWEEYRRATGHHGADRDDFGDVADFLGWYADRIHRRTGIAKDDAFRLYLAYHQGPSGYLRARGHVPAWLEAVARRVAARAARYAAQYERCREELAHRKRFWIF